MTFVDQLRDGAKKRATRSALIELDVRSRQALDNDIHDLRDDITNLCILKHVNLRKLVREVGHLRRG